MRPPIERPPRPHRAAGRPERAANAAASSCTDRSSTGGPVRRPPAAFGTGSPCARRHAKDAYGFVDERGLTGCDRAGAGSEQEGAGGFRRAGVTRRPAGWSWRGCARAGRSARVRSARERRRGERSARERSAGEPRRRERSRESRFGQQDALAWVRSVMPLAGTVGLAAVSGGRLG